MNKIFFLILVSVGFSSCLKNKIDISFFNKKNTPTQNEESKIYPNIEVLFYSEKMTKNIFSTEISNYFSPVPSIEGPFFSSSENAFQMLGSGLATDGTDLYFSDEQFIGMNARGRFMRYSLANNKISGWLGIVEKTPTGGYPECLNLKWGEMTPKWCTGGTTASINTLSANILSRYDHSTIDNANDLMYVLHSGNIARISRFKKSTGEFLGWVGKIASTPSSPPACATAALNSAAPTWCYGGDTSRGTGDGHLSNPGYITQDATYLYVAERANNRISRFNKSTGAFAGWIGVTNDVTTISPVVLTDNPTNGWSFGGTSKQSSKLGGFWSSSGIVVKDNYLYVADRFNYRIQRFNKTSGLFAGWIGVAGSTPPTAGESGNCATAVTNNFVYGWCTNGNHATGTLTGNGSMNGPTALTLSSDEEYLYLSNTAGTGGDNNGYIARYKITDGEFQGWIGRVGNSIPSSGAVGCTSLSKGDSTPGWCLGGTIDNAKSFKDGNFVQPAGLVSLNDKLYVGDYQTGQISKIDEGTGAFEGSIGAGALFQSAWSPLYTQSKQYKKPLLIIASSPSLNSGFKDFEHLGIHGIELENDIIFYIDQVTKKLAKADKITGEILGWIGRVSDTPSGGFTNCQTTSIYNLTPGWCVGGGSQGGGNGTSNGFNSPTDLAISPDAIFVTDTLANTIMKFNKLTGVFEGWIGRVNSTSGISLCTGASSNNYTPSWCKGGTANAGSSTSGFNAPRGIAYYDNEIFVVDGGNNRVVKINATTGAMTGWIGMVKTSPSGGASGCTTTTSGSPTPGWCLGGSSNASFSDGEISGAGDLFVDENYIYIVNENSSKIKRYSRLSGASAGWIGAKANYSNSSSYTLQNMGSSFVDGAFIAPRYISSDDQYFYVTDGNANGYRLQRFLKSNLSYQGWIGGVNNPPNSDATGSPGGCSAASTITPGWCLGGMPTSSSSYGSFSSNESKPIIESSFIYLGDTHKIYKINKNTGSVIGWIGRVGINTGLSPSVAVNSLTNGWSTGGEASSGTGNGHLNGAPILAIDGASLFALDKNNHRIQKYNLNTGLFEGWIGAIATIPTGGDTGCSSATVENWTPGWCLGGTSKSSAIGLNNAKDMIAKNGYLYIANTNNHHILKIDIADGSIQGWIGQVSTKPSGGDIGCSDSNQGDFTPGWCLGGVAQAQFTPHKQGFNSPIGLEADDQNLYVTSSGNGQVAKINLSSGEFIGWIGAIKFSPQSGANNCSSKIENEFTPNWCLGGLSKNIVTSNSNESLFNSLFGVHVENGNLWVVRGEAFGFASIHGFNASQGTKLSKKIGGATISENSNWASGGHAAQFGSGKFISSPRGIYVDQKYIYVSDLSYYKILRYEKTSGEFRGWFGILGSKESPYSGDQGCTNLKRKDITPGWCYGGEALEQNNNFDEFSNNLDLPFKSIWGIYSDNNDLYLGGANLIYKLKNLGK